MAKTQINSIRTVILATLGLCATVASADSNALRAVDLRAYEQTIARDDRDAGPADRIAAACEAGFATRALATPADACAVAYEKATREKRFEQALRYAAIGCEKYKSVDSCRNVGVLPLWMGNQGIVVPISFKAELKRTAEFVCFSGARIKAINGVDITGRECAYFARRFSLAKDPEYAFALEPAARRFFEAIYEPARAVRLYQAACGRLGYAHGCESRPELSQRVNRRDLEEVTEILERETGEALAGNRNIIASYVSKLPPPGTNRGAHTVTRALLWKLESIKTVERDDADAGPLGRVQYEISAPLAWNASGNANPSSIARLDIEHMTAIDVEDADLGDWFWASLREMLSEQRVR